MQIVISDTRTIHEIQKDFSAEFPYLKIEFFDTPYSEKMPIPKSRMYGSDRKISQCRKARVSGEIELNGKQTVLQLEREFWEKFGLSSQVFRKSGKLWIETSLTDSWTLERQNNEGLEMSQHKNEVPDTEESDPTDRDKWE